MSTWQILAEAGNNFRWERTGTLESPEGRDSSIRQLGSETRLPSMRDLLHQGFPRLVEDGGRQIGSSPMFRTGSGRSVAVEQSSVAAARSIIGDDDSSNGGFSERRENGGGEIGTTRMFRTGSGKSVVVKGTGIAVAKSVLGADDSTGAENGGGRTQSFSLFQKGLGRSMAAKQSLTAAIRSVDGNDDSTKAGFPKPQGNGGGTTGSAPLFRTGSGKPIAVKQCSVASAATIFGGFPRIQETSYGRIESTPLFHTGSGKSMAVKQSSVEKAWSILCDDGSNEAGKPVAVKQSSIEKAQSVLAEDGFVGSGFPKPHANGGCTTGSTAMCRMGSGKYRAVKLSSIAAVASVLHGSDFVDAGLPRSEEIGDVRIGSTSIFQTGSGTLVSVKLSVLHEDGSNGAGFIKPQEDAGGTSTTGSIPLFQTASGKFKAVKQSSVAAVETVLHGDDSIDAGSPRCQFIGAGRIGSTPMFRTGSGKSVAVKKSSIQKVQSVLGEDSFVGAGFPKTEENGDDTTGRAPIFRMGSGKIKAVSKTAVAAAGTVLCGDDSTDAGFPRCQVIGDGISGGSPMFRTGSGKSVSVKQSSIERALSVLGDEASNDAGLEHVVKHSSASDSKVWENFSPNSNNYGTTGVESVPKHLVCSESVVSECESNVEPIPNLMQLEVRNFAPKHVPIKFHSAGGRSISVSCEALQRARSLLGDPELGTFLDEMNTVCEGEIDCSLDRKNIPCASFTPQQAAKRKKLSKNFVSPLRPPSKQFQSSFMSQNMHSGDNLIKKFDAVEHESRSSSKLHLGPHGQVENSLEDSARINQPDRRPLIDVSNTISTGSENKQAITEKRRLGRMSSASPFKRPRRVSSPLYGGSTYVHNASEVSCCKRRVSTRYPSQIARVYVKEFFGVPPSQLTMLEHLSDQVRWMNPDSAGKYKFHEGSGLKSMGIEAFCQLLVQSGASLQSASKEWVANHYRWVVWKLACYERCYSAQRFGKFLTVSNVLEELKYRYEREVNHGHCSVIKKILDGDASPSTMMVLCISSVHPTCNPQVEIRSQIENNDSGAPKVELTDGWYSIDAYLDALLAKLLASGKLYVGQKLRIWGAGLCGWVGPISPLEIPREASLVLHMNGTYRAHWAERLGICKGVRVPLALSCVRSGGGPVPLTLVGIKRIYPVLFKERLKNGGFIVRSEKMETKMMQMHNQRRSDVVDGIISEFERSMDGFDDENDSEEGAKILKRLESAVEPDVLMAEMSPEQLNSFTNYQAKLKARRQLEMTGLIEKALDDAGLGLRQVTPFMRVRVISLASKSLDGNRCPREGLVTIWNPTDKQKLELIEGKAYAVPGLVPLSSDSRILYLQAKGPTTRWHPLSPTATKCFKPFFSPRGPVFLSNLGEVPVNGEFDIAAFVVYVGEVYTAAQQKRQWVFVTDGSILELQSGDISSSLLAISFCLPYVDDSFAPFNNNLAGSVVGFCNLFKRPQDHINHLWVAEAGENLTYSLSYDLPNCSHLKSAAASAERWATVSRFYIEKLKEKVLFIIRNCKA